MQIDKFIELYVFQFFPNLSGHQILLSPHKTLSVTRGAQVLQSLPRDTLLQALFVSPLPLLPLLIM